MAHGSDRPTAPRGLIGWLARWGHLPLLIGTIVFMFWMRYRPSSNFRTNDGFYLAAIDSYYQFRTTVYTVENWPNTMPYDVWTSFPNGRYVGQFGTAYDQVVATIALLVGRGVPSEALVHQTVLVIVPVFGALTAVPIYLVGKRLGGRFGGLIGVVALAFFPGQFYTRTLAGQYQHHGAEMLFMATAVAACLYALRVAEREQPVVEQEMAVGWSTLHRPVLAAGIAGVALGWYQLMWPPGVVLVGIFGTFFAGYLIVAYACGHDPELIAVVGTVSMSVAGLVTLGAIEEISLSPTSFGYLSPALAFAVAGSCAGVAVCARYWERAGIDRGWFVPTMIAIGALLVGFLWLVFPELVGRILESVGGRVVPFGTEQTTLTIDEARPPSDYLGQLAREFGVAGYTAALGLGGLILGLLRKDEHRAESALIVVWSLFLVSMSASQVRFFYYLALAVAVLNASLVGNLLELATRSPTVTRLPSHGVKQALVLCLVALVIVVPLFPGVMAGPTVFHGHSMPHESTVQWQESLEYLATSTPDVGEFGGSGDRLAYYGTHERPSDGDYAYPSGAYGIMSWWTYGHLITVDGERIPHANPFQAGARSAAAFFLAESETRANLILDALPTGARVHEKETDTLATLAGGRTAQERQEEIRYVMIDASMATDSFGTMPPWIDREMSDYTTERQTYVGQRRGTVATLPQMNSSYHNTSLASLYLHDTDRMEHYRLVHESTRTTAIGSIARETAPGEWETVASHVDFSNLDVAPAQIRTLSGYALYDLFPEVSEVKTFERVPGATIRGETEADPGSTVIVEIDLSSQTTERTFTYTQRTTVRENGTIALTVPYATSDELDPEDGYTDADVESTGPYSVRVLDDRFVSERGVVRVPEPVIYAGGDVEVDLESVDTSG